MENREKTVEALNDVLAKNYDALKGYRKAAEKTDSTRLMGFFNNRVIERTGFISELKAEIKSLGGEPTDEGTVLGSAHRAWIGFKADISNDTDEAILEECITGEKNCVNEYEEMLKEDFIPYSTRQMLQKQKGVVQRALTINHIKEDSMS